METSAPAVAPPGRAGGRYWRSPLRRLVLDDQAIAAGGDLQSTVRRGMAVSAVSRVLAQLTQLAGTVALARLLTPEEYGTVAIAVVVTGLVNVFVDLGIGAAVVQKPDLDQDDLATAFWANQVVGVSFSILCVAGSFPLALLYHQPALVLVLSVLGLSFTLSASNVQIALLERQFRFGVIGISDIAATAVGLLASIALGLAGAGAVSLSAGIVTTAAVRTVVCWSAVGGVPRGRCTRTAFGHLQRFGRGLVGFNILTFAAGNVDSITVSRTVGLVGLGVYNRAWNLMSLPVQQISHIALRVLIPALASMQDDLPRLRQVFHRILPLLVAVALPAALGLATCAPALVRLLYGPQWDEVAPILAALAFASPAMILRGALSALLQAIGLTGMQFRLGLVTTGFTVVGVLAGAHWGAVGVAVGVAVADWCGLVVVYAICSRRLGLSTWVVLRDSAGPVTAALAMAAGVWRMQALGTDWWVLLAQVAAGAGYFGALMLLFAPRMSRELLATVRRRAPVGSLDVQPSEDRDDADLSVG